MNIGRFLYGTHLWDIAADPDPFLTFIGLLEQESALRIGLNVTAVIVVFMVGGLGLSLLFAGNTGSQAEPKSERSINNRDKV